MKTYYMNYGFTLFYALTNRNWTAGISSTR